MVAASNIISPWRLIVGGRAILAPMAINQRKASWGVREMAPLVSRMLRVWVDWYEILARAKRAEEASP